MGRKLFPNFGDIAHFRVTEYQKITHFQISLVSPVVSPNHSKP